MEFFASFVVVVMVLVLPRLVLPKLIQLIRAQKAKSGDKNDEKVMTGQSDEIPQPDPLYSLTPDKVKDYDDRPWRPFRWPYHQTMSIFKLDINHWLDMDKYYVRYIQEKQRIYEEHGEMHFAWLPESEDACNELLDTVVSHMLARYPNLFKRTDNGIENLVTNEKIDLSKPLKHHPLYYVSKLAKEDFYVVKQRDDGRHYLVAAAVPFPGAHFNAKQKLGKYIDAIHADVPYYSEKLKPSMERWFSKLKPCDPVERATWYITWDYNLLFSNIYTVNGPDEMPDVSSQQYTIRVERQTLRRLPNSQAIIFTNHPVFYTIDEMKDEPGMPSILKKIILEGPEKIRQSKKLAIIQDKLVPYLDTLIQRQLDLNIISADHVVKTAPSYPFAHWVKSPYQDKGWTNPIRR
ncbi:hypothetical protein TRVA0_008S01354 [Trichomonascus vanleenenianus]|uniref:heme-dependent oxidative N-demethylase family protein n=1 Tax=Trichomonascus vanleenenianus TaxID=2268995 RepID=UPI003ECB730F